MNHIFTRREKELQESGLSDTEKNLILESIEDLVVYHDPEMRIIWANNAAGVSVDQDSRDLIGRYCWEIWHDRDTPCIGCPVIRALDTGETHMAEIKSPDGREWFIRGFPVKSEEGILKGVLEVCLDITDRKRAEAEVDRISRAYLAISRCNEAMIRTRDEYALLRDVCSIFVEIGGYRMTWIGYAKDDREKSVQPVARSGYEDGYVEKAKTTWADTERGHGPAGTAIRTKRPCVTKNVLTDPAFEPWRADAVRMGYASVLGLPLIADGEAFGVMTIYSDRTGVFDDNEIALLQEMADNLAYGIGSIRSRAERDRAEESLRKAKAQAEMYLDLMGHDISNMDQIAMGFLEIALDTIELDEHERELLVKPIEALQSSTNLIRNVKKLQQRDDNLPLYPVDVGGVLDTLASRFSDIPGRGITLRLHTGDPCTVMANGLLTDVFENLISNAIKHTTGPLIIDVRMGRVTCNGMKFCSVSVEDNGPGIPDQHKVSLFDRYKKGAARITGRGLGLYLVKSLVDNFHGDIQVEDRVPGDHTQGAKFRVLLPI